MLTQKKHIVRHILNNSSIIVDGYMTENILMGKGIGFGRKPGDTLPVGTEYEKSYQLLDKANDFHRIINGYDEHIVLMVMDTIQHIIERNNGEFNEHDFVTIADHLAAMFSRVLNGEAIISFFANETRTLYPKSFKKAEEISDIIHEKYEVHLPEAEIAYIALYLENLSSIKSKQEVEQTTSILEQMDEMFKLSDHRNIDKNSIAYSRFLIHIQLLIQSTQFRKVPLDTTISHAILKTYHEYCMLAESIIQIIEEETDKKLGESELIYLVIHLVNLFENREDRA